MIPRTFAQSSVSKSSSAPAFPDIPADSTIISSLPNFFIHASTVTCNATYTAQWKANTDIEYIVEFYYESNGKYPDEADKFVKRTGTTGETVYVSDEDKTPAEGYALDNNAAHNYSGTITGDKILVLKVYFKQQFTVTYDPGDHGTFTAKVTEGLDYGATTPDEPAVTGQAGYTFTGRDKDIAETVTENVTYTAQWKAIYYPPIGPITPVEPESVFTVTYMDGVDDEVVFEDQSTTNLKAGDKTPAFNGTPTREGYKFIGWTPEVAETVSGDAVYVAQWEKVDEDKTDDDKTDVDPAGDDTKPIDGNDSDGTKNTDSKGVKTGDESMLAMWFALASLAALGLGGTLVLGRRKENE